MEKLAFTKNDGKEQISATEITAIYSMMRKNGISEDDIEYYFSLDRQGVLNSTMLSKFSSGMLRIINRLYESENYEYGKELQTVLNDIQTDAYIYEGDIYFKAEHLTNYGFFEEKDFSNIRIDPSLDRVYGYHYEDGVLYLSLRALESTINCMFFTKKVEVKKILTYLMTDASGYFKIGKTTDVEKRLNTFRTGNPTIRLLHIINNNVETELHRTYRSKRFIGEWFCLSKHDINEIIRRN
jgi:hypothetical protein